VASAKSFYSDVLGWETDDQPIGAFTYTVMRSADAGDEQRSERHHAAQPEMAAAPSHAPVGFEVADCDVAAASWKAVFDLVKGISCDPLRASGFDSSG
jgi:predicted enzyme related to lactoylglutathione lyase